MIHEKLVNLATPSFSSKNPTGPWFPWRSCQSEKLILPCLLRGRGRLRTRLARFLFGLAALLSNPVAQLRLAGREKGLPAVPPRWMLQVVCAGAHVTTAGVSVVPILACQHVSHITHPLITNCITKTQPEEQEQRNSGVWLRVKMVYSKHVCRPDCK